jgi:diguanylate cyclase (GGDEF)-like protein
LGRAPFGGIALLAFVLVSVIGGYAVWQYRDSALATIAVEREIRGLDFVTQAMTTLVDWGGAGAKEFATSPRVEADLANLERAAAAMPDVNGAAGSVAVIRQARDAARANPGPAASAAFGEAVLDAIARIADASGLAFDPQGEPNALGDALDNPLALEFERLNAAFETASASGANAPSIPQRLTVAGQIGAAETASAPLAVDLRGAFAADGSARARLDAPWAQEEASAARLRAAMAEATAGRPSPRALDTAHARLVASTARFTSALADSVRKLLEQRLVALERDRVAIVVQCALGILLSFLVAFLIARDVIRRQRRALFRAQRDSAAEHFRTVFERSPMGIAMLDAEGATIESNAGLGRMLDAREPRIVPDGDPEYAELVEGRVALYRFERHWTRSDGTSLWAEVTVSPVGGPHFGHVVAIAMVQDVTERRASDATLRFAATHDALTALPNRTEFMRHLNEVIASETGAGGRYAVLFIDLDEFKAVNDRLGHLAGDRVLETAAERIRKASRASDLVARFHGDEFGLLLVGVDGMRVAGGVAERVQEELRAPIFIDGHRVFVAPSIGIVLGDPRYTRAEDVLRDADSAMYKAKSLGGSRSVAFEYPAAS